MNMAALVRGISPRAELCTKCNFTTRLVFYSKFEFDSRPAYVCKSCEQIAIAKTDLWRRIYDRA